MRKQFKLLRKDGRVYILKWVAEGKLFGAEWDAVATFADVGKTFEQCKRIVTQLNECQERTNHHDCK